MYGRVALRVYIQVEDMRDVAMRADSDCRNIRVWDLYFVPVVSGEVLADHEDGASSGGAVSSMYYRVNNAPVGGAVGFVIAIDVRFLQREDAPFGRLGEV